jgi:ribonuclease T2
MNKFLVTVLVLNTIVWGRFEAVPSEACEAYNNMKHTKNTHHVVLDTSREYMVLKHHKKQNLVLIKGEQPAQRWVDDSCFSHSKKNTLNHKNPQVKKVSIKDELARASTNMRKPKAVKRVRSSSKQNLLALSWHNAFCETHRYKKECKRGLGSLLRSKPAEKSFVLHGLWPQPRQNVYCHVNSNDKYLDKNKRWHKLKSLGLSASTKAALKAVMPGFNSHLHKHEWIKHGTCYGASADQYYADAISLVKQVNNSVLGAFFTQNIGKIITLKQIKLLADKSFGRGAGSRVELQCKGGLVTELWLHIGSGSDDLATLLQRGKSRRSRCTKGRIDKAGFGR